MFAILREVIDKSMTLSSVEDFDSYYLTLMGNLGFDVASFHVLQRGLHLKTNAEIPLLHNFPEEWVHRYVTEQLYKNDPVMAQVPKQREPFHWFKVEELRMLRPAEKRFLKQLKQAGFSDGLAVPLYGPEGEVAYAGLGIFKGEIKWSDTDLILLQYCIYQIYNKCREMHPDKNPIPTQLLTPREREILFWASIGKSNNAIAGILNISEHTVDSLLRRIFRKLDVTSRVSAVVKAVQWGIINP